MCHDNSLEELSGSVGGDADTLLGSEVKKEDNGSDYFNVLAVNCCQHHLPTP